jgi:hypothetical protein
LGYKGAPLAHGKNFPAIATVKTKLKDNKWLGARNEDHKNNLEVAWQKNLEHFVKLRWPTNFARKRYARQ